MNRGSGHRTRHTRQPPKPGPRSLRRQHTPASTCDLRAAEDPRWRSARPKVADLVGFGLQSRSAMGCPWFDSFSCRPRRVRLARADRNLDTLRRSISRTLAMAAGRPEYSANWDGPAGRGEGVLVVSHRHRGCGRRARRRRIRRWVAYRGAADGSMRGVTVHAGARRSRAGLERRRSHRADAP